MTTPHPDFTEPPIPAVLRPREPGQDVGLNGQPVYGRNSDGRTYHRDQYRDVEEEKSMRPLNTEVSPAGVVWLLALLSIGVAYFMPMGALGLLGEAGRWAQETFAQAMSPSILPVEPGGDPSGPRNLLEAMQPLIIPAVGFAALWVLTALLAVVCTVKASNLSAILGATAFFIAPLVVWFIAPAWVDGFYFYME